MSGDTRRTNTEEGAACACGPRADCCSPEPANAGGHDAKDEPAESKGTR